MSMVADFTRGFREEIKRINAEENGVTSTAPLETPDLEEAPKASEKDEIYFEARPLQGWKSVWRPWKRLMLKEFRLSSGHLTIISQTGKKIDSDLAAVSSKYWDQKVQHVPGAKYRHFYVAVDRQKIHFRDIPFIFTDDEYEAMFRVLHPQPTFNQRVMNKILLGLGVTGFVLLKVVPWFRHLIGNH